MAIRKVAVMGHPVLRQVAAPIPESEVATPKIQTLIKDMVETMFEYDGRGLAAPQIYESIQLVVMVWDFEPEVEPFIKVLINPVIQAVTDETAPFWEGCLSLPGLRGKVSRPTKISVKALDQKARAVDFVAEGFMATVIQHECDHLLGKLYVDRMTDFTQFAFNREYGKFLSQAEEQESAEESEA